MAKRHLPLKATVWGFHSVKHGCVVWYWSFDWGSATVRSRVYMTESRARSSLSRWCRRRGIAYRIVKELET